MPRKQEISISFQGQPGDAKDTLAKKVFKQFQGELIGCGTWLDEPPVRDMQYDVPAAKTADCIAALKKAGFKNAAVVTPA